ncbi:VOC family protein [Pseudarthrobacter sp. SL88]|uniref:VOC family protein n=1 Tax=Pseudarthrobacter sp. SL88 TaxID=2994666 RepID=UPI0022742EDE|nr:VOC family protein [Pseudarthrobacter sp. SL88]MCY1675766.1 VOC family protein [Pseudarthrobacter sp. SL88]
MNNDSKGTLHHIELWVPDLGRAKQEWGWALTNLGYSIHQSWSAGISWRLGLTYIVAEQSPGMSSSEHERTRPGLNHLALHAGNKEDLDLFVEESRHHGWVQLFQEKYPFAGGSEHYAAYLVNSDGFELELVATI